MSKHIEKLKKQLVEIAEVVNSFSSEAVQLRVVERLLDTMMESEKPENDGIDLSHKKIEKQHASEHTEPEVKGAKKPGATKVLSQLLTTSYFDNAHSISAISDYCKENYDSEFKTSELSGILLKLANEHKLKRQRSEENNRFEYIKD